MSRTICIGDVHGCYREMINLLDKLNYDPAGDRVIFAGDLVDRGYYSADVVQWIRLQAKAGRKVECVLGNHDDKHFRYFKHTLKKREHSNYKIPMRAFNLDKLQVFNSLSDDDLTWLGTLPAFIHVQESDWVVVHAGLEPGKTLDDQDVGKVSHIRFLNPETRKTVSLDDNFLPPDGSVYWTDVYDLEHHVVYGHNVHSLSNPHMVIKPNGAQLVGIDTGACFGGCLTGFILPETKEERVTSCHFVQVRAEKVYSRSLLHHT